MALWPFRRRGSRKRSPGRGRQSTGEPQGLPKSKTDPTAAPDTMRPVAGGNTGFNMKTQRDNSNKLQRRPRYSFSPGRRDSIRIARARPAGPIPVATNEVYGAKKQGLPADAARHRAAQGKETGADIWDRVPTLYHSISLNKRRGQPLPRRKSSKRRKEDHNREIEIKALSHAYTAPVPPAADSGTMGRPMKKDTKWVRPGLSSRRGWDGPDSDISLPIPESMHSSMSSESEQTSWKVSALDVLAPRPTLRYASNPVYARRASSGSGPLRSTSQKRKFSEREPISKETLRAHKRIDDLVDGLDASDLRELMERDRRRRERKSEKDRDRVERRLARRLEKHRAESEEAERNGTPPPQNLERGVLGRDTIKLGSDPLSAVVTSSRRRSSVDTSRKRGKRPANLDLDEQSNRRKTPSPLDKFHRTDSIPLEPSTAAETQKPEPVPIHEEGRSEARTPSSRSRSQSPKIMGFIRSRKRRSQSPIKPDSEEGRAEFPPNSTSGASRLASESKESVSGGRTSDGSTSRPWTSIFKWGKKRRTSGGPASFSNTSRDSMRESASSQTLQPPVNYVPVHQLSSKVPKRTMSRFREDLPELPLSPPDSRVASPEAENVTAKPLPIIADDVAMRYHTPESDNRATPMSIDRDEMQASPAPLSMSLASIDSEASWLSGGRARKRASSGMRGSLQNQPVQSVSGDSEGHEGDKDAIASDEFLRTAANRKQNLKSTGEALPSSDEGEGSQVGSPKWGAVNQTPRVIHHTDTMRSREGFLDSYDDEREYGFDRDSEERHFEGETTMQHRATSVNYSKGHFRNFSAGSAKLLGIASRASGENRRSNNEPAAQ